MELFTDNLVKKIKMEAYGPPMIQYFGHGNKAGLTLVQLITTSSVVGHFCEETGDAYIDVFSCKSFDTGIASDVIKDWFKPVSMDIKVVMRQAGERME